MGFLKKAFSFIGRPTYSRTLVMIVLVAAVSLTVVASQQQQTTKQQAAFLKSPDFQTTPPTPTPTKLCTRNDGLLWVTNLNIRFHCPLIDKAFVDEADCNTQCAAAQPTPTSAPAPTAVPTPTTIPKLFPCKNQAGTTYGGNYACASNNPESQCNFLQGNYKDFPIPTPFTGLDCNDGTGRDYKNTQVCCKQEATPAPIPTSIPTATTAPTSTTPKVCITQSDITTMVGKYIEGLTEVYTLSDGITKFDKINLENVNKAAILYNSRDKTVCLQ